MNLTFIQIYTPTSDYEDEVIEELYKIICKYNQVGSIHI